MAISDHEFNLIRALVHKQFGIKLTEQKKALLVGRLQKLVRDSGFTSFADYYNLVLQNPTSNALSELVNRISTNYTFFNREPEHFRFFQETALPEAIARMKAKNDFTLRVWCAAASTGEEPYMLGMLMMETLAESYHLWDAGILATDISIKALETARKGVYEKEQLDMLPKQYQKKYFNRLGDGHFEITPRLKRELTFRRFNLINKTFPFKRKFDIIFCRNVMIYFDQETKDQLIRQLYENLVPGGYLFIGHSEAILRHKCPFRSVLPAVYKRER